MTSIRFGVNVTTSAAPGADPVAAAQAAEELGFDLVSATDHPAGTAPTYETVTLLTWIAAATSRISVASRVLAVPLRAPAMVAKTAESLSRLSGGRFILGLGAGASDAELRAFGCATLSPGQKIEGLADAVRVIRGMWSEPGFSYAGRRHSVAAADLEPKPAAPIPVWLGTFGPRALRVTGQLADGWIPSLGYVRREELAQLRAQVLAAARAAGRDAGAITCALNVQVALGGSAPSDPATLTGSPGEVAAELAGFAAQGFTTFNVIFVGEDVPEQQARFAAEVMPAVRSAAG